MMESHYQTHAQRLRIQIKGSICGNTPVKSKEALCVQTHAFMFTPKPPPKYRFELERRLDSEILPELSCIAM